MSELNKQIRIGICGDVWLATECLYGDLKPGDLWFRRGIGGIEQLVREFSERRSVTLKTEGCPACLPHKQVYRLEPVQAKPLSGESEETSQPLDDSDPQAFAIWRMLQVNSRALDEELSKMDEIDMEDDAPLIQPTSSFTVPQKLVLKGRWEKAKAFPDRWLYFIGKTHVATMWKPRARGGWRLRTLLDFEGTYTHIHPTLLQEAVSHAQKVLDQHFAKISPHIQIKHPAFPEVE